MEQVEIHNSKLRTKIFSNLNDTFHICIKTFFLLMLFVIVTVAISQFMYFVHVLKRAKKIYTENSLFASYFALYAFKSNV